MNKRGQGAGGAAGLIAIIAALIVIYILLLPSPERAKLLNQTEEADGRAAGKATELLVFEHPGTLDPLKNRDREKILDSFNLYSEKQAIVLESLDATHLERGWFREKAYNLTFSVTDLANTENFIVAFDVAKARGRLIIFLNGKEIYDAEVSPGNVAPINLDKTDIGGQNSLYFVVSGVGAAFWRLNEYDLKNIRVIADFTDISKREYKNFFVVSATEKQNLESSKLTFVPNCLTQKVGPLSIWINERQIPYSAIPDCGLLSTLEFDPNYLKQGENVIRFKADEGNYLVDRVKVKLTLRELGYPTYYFEIKREDFVNVDANKANVTLQLRFADFDQKKGALNVNGHLSDIDTDEITFSKNINSFIEEGQNSLQITPKTILNIVDLNVTLNR